MATMTLRPNQPQPPNKVATNMIAISDYLWWWNGKVVPQDNRYTLSLFDFTIDMFPRFDYKDITSIRFSTINLSSPNLMFKYKSTGQNVKVGDVINIVNNQLSKEIYLDSPPSHVDYVYTGVIECEYAVNGNYISNSVLAIDVFRFSAYESIHNEFSTSNAIQVNTHRTFRFTPFHFSTMIGYNQVLHSNLMVDPNIILQMNQWFGTSGKIPYKIEIVRASSRIKYFDIPVEVGQKIPINAIGSGHLTMDTQGLTTGDYLEIKIGNGYIGYFLLEPKL